MAKKVYDESQMAAAPPNQGSKSPVPQDVRRLNGGVFWVTPIWAIAHKAWIALVVWVVVMVIAFLPALEKISFSALPIWAALAAFGNTWAWQNKDWKSIAEFHRTQRLWALWGFGAQILMATILIVVMFVLSGRIVKASEDFICDMEKMNLTMAFSGKSFDNSQAMANELFAHLQRVEKFSEEEIKKDPSLPPFPEPQIRGDVVISGTSTIKLISKGDCAPGLKNCSVYVYTKDFATDKEKLSCKFYFENGGNIIPAPLPKGE